MRGFIPTLRDALFQTFMSASPRSRYRSLFRMRDPAQVELERLQQVRRPIMKVFKVLGGRMLCQLHSRAARTTQIPDTWFHAPDLQRGQFHKGAPGPACVLLMFGRCSRYAHRTPSSVCQRWPLAKLGSIAW